MGGLLDWLTNILGRYAGILLVDVGGNPDVSELFVLWAALNYKKFNGEPSGTDVLVPVLYTSFEIMVPSVPDFSCRARNS